MLDAEITGDSHPKKVVLVSDDKGAENVKLAEDFEEFFGEDTEMALRATADLDADGKLRIEVPTEDIGNVIDYLEGDFYGTPAQEKLEAMRQEAFAEAEEALG